MDKETLTDSVSGDGNVKWCNIEDLPDLPLYDFAKKENWYKFATGKYK